MRHIQPLWPPSAPTLVNTTTPLESATPFADDSQTLNPQPLEAIMEDMEDNNRETNNPLTATKQGEDHTMVGT